MAPVAQTVIAKKKIQSCRSRSNVSESLKINRTGSIHNNFYPGKYFIQFPVVHDQTVFVLMFRSSTAGSLTVRNAYVPYSCYF
jgi:hypothetical protein